MSVASETADSELEEDVLLSDLIDRVSRPTGNDSLSESVPNDRRNNDLLVGNAVGVLLEIGAPGNAANFGLPQDNMAIGTRSNTRPEPLVDNDNANAEAGRVIVETVADEDSESEGEFVDPPIRDLVPNAEEAFDNGYDTEGEGPPANRTNKEEELLEEDTLGEEEPGDTDAGVAVNNDENEDDDEIQVLDPAPMVPVPLTEDVLQALKVGELKEELRIRCVTYPSRLKKPELLERLRAALHLPVTAVRGGAPVAGHRATKDKTKDDLAEFAPGSYWRSLSHKDVAVDEPENLLIARARAPTVAAEDADKDLLPKHNFKESFWYKTR